MKSGEAGHGLYRGAALGLMLFAALAPGGASAQTRAFARFTETGGQAIYEGVCQGCHMPNGRGAAGAGAYPSLAKNPRLAAAAYPALIILRGQKAMPEFGSAFSDAQIAEVVNYVRSNFGNAYHDRLTTADVAKLRSEAGLAN